MMYSADQVAELLGLHVRTVRSYLRDGRLRAVRIGKQYRIAQADLDAFTGAPAVAPSAGAVEVTSVVRIDPIDPALAERLSTYLVAGAQAPRSCESAPRPLRARARRSELHL